MVKQDYKFFCEKTYKKNDQRIIEYQDYKLSDIFFTKPDHLVKAIMLKGKHQIKNKEKAVPDYYLHNALNDYWNPVFNNWKPKGAQEKNEQFLRICAQNLLRKKNQEMRETLTKAINAINESSLSEEKKKTFSHQVIQYMGVTSMKDILFESSMKTLIEDFIYEKKFNMTHIDHDERDGCKSENKFVSLFKENYEKYAEFIDKYFEGKRNIKEIIGTKMYAFYCQRIDNELLYWTSFLVSHSQHNANILRQKVEELKNALEDKVKELETKIANIEKKNE